MDQPEDHAVSALRRILHEQQARREEARQALRASPAYRLGWVAGRIMRATDRPREALSIAWGRVRYGYDEGREP